MALKGKRKIIFGVMVVAGFCVPGMAQTHSADTNGDYAISLSELLRVIQFHNSDGLHCEAGTEDGYAQGPAPDKGLPPLVHDQGVSSRTTAKDGCFPHDSDYTPQDWRISLTEVLRLIQFFRSDGYHLEEGTEDGFSPNGPPNEGTSETFLLPGGVPLTMMWVPAGTYTMGSPDTEQDHLSDEGPQHPVTVPGFWMGKYELTKAQWTAVMETTPWSGRSCVLHDPNSPAVYVSWNDAQSFITALNTYTGLTFRLPSESEWEYACRAGTTTRFYWGDDPSYTVGNAYCWWTYNVWEIGELYAHVVGLKLPNLFGLYDMSGNVWEWCEDDSHGDYRVAPSDGTSWVDSPRGSYRVLRGGSWGSSGSYCRSAPRYDYYPSSTCNYLGLRLAR